jgi:YD repeat-containing protein
VDLGEGRIAAEVRDSRGNLLRTVQSLDGHADPAEQQFLVTVYRYNMRGLLTHESMPFVVTGAENRYTQDPADPAEDPGAWSQLVKYDGEGRRILAIDALGNVSTWTYDSEDRVIKSTDPQGNVTHNVYDPRTGSLLENYFTVGASGLKYNHVRYEYWQGLPTAVYRISPEGVETLISSTQYESGNAGWLVTRTLYDQEGRVEFTADAYFVLAANYPAGADVAWHGTRSVYDLYDRVIRTERHDGVTIELTDDPGHTGQKAN